MKTSYNLHFFAKWKICKIVQTHANYVIIIMMKCYQVQMDNNTTTVMEIFFFREMQEWEYRQRFIAEMTVLH